MELATFLCTLLLLGLAGWMLISAAKQKGGLAALAAGGEDQPLSRDRAVLYWTLILLTSLLRLYRFGTVPGGFNQDGAMAAVDALALAHHGTDRFGTWLPAHFTAWGYGQMSVLLSYCMAPLFRLFGMNNVTARLPMLLWSFAGMAAAYGLLRGLISRRAGLLGLLALALCPWHFMQSRWALDCNLLPHTFLVGLALLWRGTKKPAALYASMVFFALSMYSYGVAFLPVPLFLLGACALLLRGKWLRWPRVLGCAALYFGLAWPIYGTMAINALGLSTVELPFVTLPFFPQSVRANDLIFYSPAPLQQLVQNAKALWSVGFRQAPDLPWNAIDGFGTVYSCSWPLLALGLGLSLARAFRAEDPRRRLGYRLLLLYWLSALVTGLCVNNVNVNRVNILFYAHVLFIVIALEALIRLRPSTAWPVLACYALSAALFFQSYFGPWAEQISASFYQDFLEAVSWAGEREDAVLVLTPDVQYTGGRQVTEILTLYALDVDAEYFQGRTGDPLPYGQRFLYRNLRAEDLEQPQAGRLFVMKRSALPAALPPGWSLQDFGSYCVVYYGG